MTKIPAAAFLVALVLVSLSPARAASGTWDPSAGSGLWSGSTNWVGGVIPDGASSTALLEKNADAGTTVTIDGAAGRTLGILNIAGTNYWTVAASGGGTLTFDNVLANAEINIANSGKSNYQTHTISAPVSLNSSLVINNNDPKRYLTVNAVISGTGSITKNGPGTLRFSSGITNLFAGGFILNGGSVQADNTKSFGTGTLTLNSGSVINANGQSRTYTNTLVLGGDVTLNAPGAGVNTFSGTTTLTGTRVLTVDTAAAVLSGVIGDGGTGYGITKAGTGTLTLSNANTYKGNTTLTAGTMIVSNDAGFGTTGEVLISGANAATLQINRLVRIDNNIVYSNTNASSSIQRVVASGLTFDVGTITKTLSSEFSGGQDDTTAALRAGSALIDTTFTMSFADTSAASNDGSRISDVFNLSLTSTQTYALQLSTGMAPSSDLYLGWLNGGSWVEATTGNTGTAGTLAGQYAMSWDAFLVEKGAYNATTMLGAYGYDPTTATAWAVLNHNSAYALVVPEPSTTLLLGLGMGLALFRRRSRRS